MSPRHEYAINYSKIQFKKNSFQNCFVHMIWMGFKIVVQR